MFEHRSHGLGIRQALLKRSDGAAIPHKDKRIDELNHSARYLHFPRYFRNTFLLPLLIKDLALLAGVGAITLGHTSLDKSAMTIMIGIAIVSFTIDALLLTYAHRRLSGLYRTWCFFKQAVGISPVSLTIYDMTNQSLVYASEGTPNPAGIPKENIADETNLVNQHAYTEDIATIEQHQAQLRSLKDGGWLDLAFRWHHRDGSLRHLFSRSSPFARDANGTVTQFMSATVDLTATKQIEESTRRAMEAIEAERKQIQQILDLNTDGWWDWDMTKPDQWYLSPSFLRLLGYSDNEASPSVLWKNVIHPDDLVRAQETLAAHLNSDGATPYQLEIRYRHRNGQFVWTQATGKALKDSDGKYCRMVGIYTNISHLKHLQLRLLQSNDELHQFAHIAAHDLRAPIRTISCWTDVLRASIPSPRTEILEQALNIVQKGARHADRLITDLLTLACIELHDSQLELVDLNKLVAGIIHLFADEMQRASANIAVSELPPISGVPSQLDSLFSNLIHNALIYRSFTRPLAVTISAKKLVDYYEFSVADNGIGIATEHSDIIFNMFKRLHNSDTIPGTGIGLAICRKVVELNGGKLWVESTLDVGSAFKFTWPIR